jgi:hypothetical protein
MNVVNGKYCTKRISAIHTTHPILLGHSNKRGYDGSDMYNSWTTEHTLVSLELHKESEL